MSALNEVIPVNWIIFSTIDKNGEMETIGVDILNPRTKSLLKKNSNFYLE